MVRACGIPSCSAPASHSGDIYFEFGLLPDLAKMHAQLGQVGGLDAFIEKIPTWKPKSHFPFYSLLGMLCYGAAYAPNPDAPLGFDMPIDMETGELVDAVWQRWLAWDPVRLIDAPEHIAAYRQMTTSISTAGCGTSSILPLAHASCRANCRRGHRP